MTLIGDTRLLVNLKVKYKLKHSQISIIFVVTIFDENISHLNLQIIELARSKCISVLILPLHTSDILQPLDKCCFCSLKMLSDKKVFKKNFNVGTRNQ